jgi:hypothetical protein
MAALLQSIAVLNVVPTNIELYPKGYWLMRYSLFFD